MSPILYVFDDETSLLDFILYQLNAFFPPCGAIYSNTCHMFSEFCPIVYLVGLRNYVI